MQHPSFRADCLAVAVAFDHHTMGLVEAAAGMCQRLRKPLCLLHVIEPWLEQSYPQPLGARDVLWDSTLAVETSTRERALSRMDEIIAQLPSDLVVRKAVVAGKVVPTLCREAQHMGAGLLFLGAGARSDHHWSSGYATALAVVAATTVPVAILDTTKMRLLSGQRPRLLLTDDLGPVSLGARNFAMGLMAALGDGEIWHYHVTGVTPEVLDAVLTTATAASHSPADPAAGADVHPRLLQSLRDRLEQCAAPYRQSLREAGCMYNSLVCAGDVVDSVLGATKDLVPDAIVFGRHKAVHTDPFFIGRVPLRAMMRLPRPVIIVPNE